MSKIYDIIVIGSGAAAQTVVYELTKSGKKVAIIEKKKWGGTCALRGCVPKKVLVGAAEIKNRVSDAKGNGISFDSFSIDWPDLIEFKKTFTDQKPDQFKKSFQEADIDIHEGEAHFIGKQSIEVNNKKLTSDYFVIASGAKSRPLKIQGEEHVITSEQFLTLPALPETLLFIGGGMISFEFAHIASRAGVQVTILHRSEHLLKNFDPDLVQMLQEASKEIGITIKLNKPVKQVQKENDRYIVITDKGDTFETDLVVHGAGRVPNMDELDLEKANISFNKRGIEVDSNMQNTANKSVFAAGDAAASNLPLTPVAGAEGKIVLSNLLDRKNQESTISVIPTVLFTVPPLATVGLTEDQAREKGISYTVNFKDTSSWFTSRRIGLKHSGFKVLISKKDQTIIGAHLFGHHAEELINLFAVFIKKNMKVEEIKDLIWSYPSSCYDINYML